MIVGRSCCLQIAYNCDILLTICMNVPSGIFTVEEAHKLGLSRVQLSELVKRGVVERLARGVYIKSGEAYSSMIEAVILVKRGVDFVVSLESALRFHDFTYATPHALWVAMKRGSRRPAVEFPIEIITLDSTYDDGVEIRNMDGVAIKVYSAARTVADLFKFRNRVGMEIAIAALKEGLRKKLFSVDELIKYAKICRVQKIIAPYVEGYFG